MTGPLGGLIEVIELAYGGQPGLGSNSSRRQECPATALVLVKSLRIGGCLVIRLLTPPVVCLTLGNLIPYVFLQMIWVAT